MSYHALLKAIGSGEHYEDPDRYFVHDIFNLLNSLERAYAEMLNVPLSLENIAQEFIKAETPFPLIVGLGHLELVKIMISNGVDVNKPMTQNYRALHTACLRGDVEMAELLLQNGANVNDRDGDYLSPLSSFLHISAILVFQQTIGVHSCNKMPQLLVSYGAKLGRSDMGAFEKAVSYANLDTLRLLVNEANGDLSYRTSYGDSCLHAAAVSCKPGVLEYLIEEFKRGNMDLDTRNNSNVTALMRASHRNTQNHEAVKMLLKSGANFRIRDNTDRTSFHLLIEGKRKPELAWLLFDLGFDILNWEETLLAQAVQLKSSWVADIVAEIAKKEMMGARIVGINQMVFDLCREARRHQRFCKKQLREMQKTTFYENVSFWDVLSGEHARLMEYSKNSDLVKAFFTTKCNGAFPSYCARIRQKFVEILSRNSLIDLSTYVVCETIKRPSIYEILQHEVMTYMEDYDFAKILCCCREV